MTLLTACQSALRESGQFTVPTTIVSNTDPTAVQLLALANRTGRAIAKKNWQVLQTDYSFATASGNDTYALPADYDRFSNLTFWDQTNSTAVAGPVTAMVWQALQSSTVAGALRFQKAFRIAGGQFIIWPEPSAVETIAYTYYTTRWITGKTEFTADSDTTLYPEDLLILGLKWRWLQAKGDAFENEKYEYMEQLDLALSNDGGRDAIRFADATRSPVRGGNLPETGFGL